MIISLLFVIADYDGDGWVIQDDLQRNVRANVWRPVMCRASLKILGHHLFYLSSIESVYFFHIWNLPWGNKFHLIHLNILIIRNIWAILLIWLSYLASLRPTPPCIGIPFTSFIQNIMSMAPLMHLRWWQNLRFSKKSDQVNCVDSVFIIFESAESAEFGGSGESVDSGKSGEFDESGNYH